MTATHWTWAKWVAASLAVGVGLLALEILWAHIELLW